MAKAKEQTTRKQNAGGVTQLGRGEQAAATRRVGAKGSQAIGGVLPTPKRARQTRNWTSATATTRVGQDSKPQSHRTSPHDSWLITNVDDLIRRFAEHKTADLKSFAGIFVNSATATSIQKERLLGLFACEDLGLSINFLPSLRVIRRVIEAQSHGYGDAVIAQAFAVGRKLMVQDANLEYFSFHANDYVPLRDLSEEQLANFAVDSAGSGLHWKALDLDLDLEGLKLGASEDLQAKANASTQSHRQATAQSLRSWLKLNPQVQPNLSTEEASTVALILSGKSDLSSALIKRMAAITGRPANDLLEALAQNRPSLDQSIPSR